MNWHALSSKEVLEKLDSNVNGLSREEVEKRIKEHGEIN